MAPLLLSLAIGIAAASGLPALLFSGGSSFAERLSLALMLLASGLGLAGAAIGIFSPPSSALGLALPALAVSSFGIDPLSAFFLFPIFLVGGLGTLYATGYRPASKHPRTARRASVFWGLLVAGLAILVVARNAFAFLLGWEIMALSAFFLITLDDGLAETRKAGLVYIIATHIGTLLLFALFALWNHATGSFDFARPPEGLLDVATTNMIFLLVLLAFGLKAGMMPLHFWLPGAHAAAPSHVSAMLSGVVLKMGIYGLLRFILLLLPGLPAFWGTTILLLGAVSALIGVVFALAQHDLKRLLAYHSVENIGIILMGIGLALLGYSSSKPTWIILGLGAALLHVWNHGLFKSLLFLGAGSVVEATGTRRIDRLGGLSRTMPWTAGLFLVGALAISGLPPLNGFLSEFMLYLGTIRGAVEPAGGGVAAIVVVPILAATGSLALACFVKVYGIVFLGMARGPLPRVPKEAPASMLVPMATLALACLFIGLVPAFAGLVLDPLLAFWSLTTERRLYPIGSQVPIPELGVAGPVLLIVIIVISIAVFLASRPAVDGRRDVHGRRDIGTWDCGYAAPTPRMQYTASSFGRFIAGSFSWILRPRIDAARPEGAFPSGSSMESHVDDATLDRLIIPLSRGIETRSGWFRRFQQGLTQHYLLYILITLLLLLGTLVPFGEWLGSVLAG